MPNEPKKPEITLVLSDFLESLLRSDEYRHLGKFSHLAEIISIKLEKAGSLEYKVINYPNDERPDWKGPYVWIRDCWLTEHTKWLSDKKRSEDARIARYILDENIRRLTRKCMEYFCMDEIFGSATARELIVKNRTNGIKEIKGKLITKVEEI